MSETLRGVLPSVYARLLSPQFDRPAVVEARATCSDCQMCDKGQLPANVSAVFFRPDLKCCTFQPSLPNYLVGGLLADPRPELEEGRRRIRLQIESRIGVSPHWMTASPKYRLLYLASRFSAFGRSEHLKCPFLTEDARCSIWPYREATCTSFHCKYVDGLQGAHFWRALKDYLVHTQNSLVGWAASRVSREVLEPTRDERELSRNELEDLPPDDATYRASWGSWVSREESFYIECSKHVRDLGRKEFARLVDDTKRGQEVLKNLMARYAALGQPKVPERARLHRKLRELPIVDNGVVVTTPYNHYDSFRLDGDLYEVLQEFGADATTEETLARLRDEHGIELDDALLKHLATHQILVESEKK